MITGVEIEIVSGSEIYTRKYVVGQIPKGHHFQITAKVIGITESGGMENRLSIHFENGKKIRYNTTANNLLSWRTQIDKGYNKESKLVKGVPWRDMRNDM